nr:hypothetical protein [Algibacter onchidii]
MNKLLSERHVNVNEDPVKSLGVIFNINEIDDFELFTKFADLIKVRPNITKIIAFSQNEKESVKSWDKCYNRRDFGRHGIVKNAELDTFLNTEFDLLISYYEEEILELKLMTALSKAKFKIGILQADERLNDLIIKTKLKNIDLFKKEVYKYLKILKKIK